MAGAFCRMFANILRMLVFFTLRVIEMLLGLAVRLCYWSVRAYGWARVMWMVGAGLVAVWLHGLIGEMGWDARTVMTIAALMGVIYGGGMLAGRAISEVAGGAEFGRMALVGRGATSSGDSRTPSSKPASDRVSLSVFHQTEPSALWERFAAPATLREAWQRVLVRGGGPGSDGVTVEAFALEADAQIRMLVEELWTGRYRPQPPRWVRIPKSGGGLRRVAVLCVRDRVAQLAAHTLLSRVWNPCFMPCSYAYRPGRSALQAVAAVEEGLAQGRVWVVDADVESFFDRVPHLTLFRLWGDWLPDERLRWFVQTSLQGVCLDKGLGLPQGAPLSPVLANLYLHGFDVALTEAGYGLVRYSDDFVVLCATRLQAQEALRMAEILLQRLGLRLKREKTGIAHRNEGFTFLGYTFSASGKRPSDQSVSGFRDRLRVLSGDADRRQALVGWRGYFGQEGLQSLAEDGTLDAFDGSPALAATRALGAMSVDYTGEDLSCADRLPATDSSLQEEDSSESLLAQGSYEASHPPCLSAFRQRFVGRGDVFARYWRSGNRKGYLPVRRELRDDDLEAHLKGQEVLGTYLLSPTGLTTALVLDIDGPATPDGQRDTLELARRLVGTLHEAAVRPLWFSSGGKGLHLWFCFLEPVSAGIVRRWAWAWLDSFRPLPQHVQVELFPKQNHVADGALGSLIRLPLGRHPVTGRCSCLLNQSGEAVIHPWTEMESTPWVDPIDLPRDSGPVRAATGAVLEPAEALVPLVEGCALIRGTIHKAELEPHLRHVERLALLYVLGTCGEPGRAYLHQVIGLCSNYDPKITERWIRRLREGHKPIRCGTLREWLVDHLPGVGCECMPAGQRHSPLELLPKADALDKTGRAAPVLTEDEWERVEADLFRP